MEVSGVWTEGIITHLWRWELCFNNIDLPWWLFVADLGWTFDKPGFAAPAGHTELGFPVPAAECNYSRPREEEGGRSLCSHRSTDFVWLHQRSLCSQYCIKQWRHSHPIWSILISDNSWKAGHKSSWTQLLDRTRVGHSHESGSAVWARSSFTKLLRKAGPSWT